VFVAVAATEAVLTEDTEAALFVAVGPGLPAVLV